MRPSGPLLVVVGALLLAYGGSGVWLELATVREVGGVEVTGVTLVSGGEYAPAALPLGLLLVLLGGLGFLRSGGVRRVAGGLAVPVAVAGAWTVAAGLPAAMAEGGALSAAPWSGLVGAACAVVGGALTLRAPAAPLLDERYTVEGADRGEDDEWALAADEDGGPDDPDAPLR